MTRNILIATLFTLGTAVLLGLIFLQENPRMDQATGAITAERVERGAQDFEQYCATCHGLAGQGGVGPSLYDIQQRYYQPGDDGTVLADVPNGVTDKYGTLRNYIEATLFSGVRGTQMPAFGAQGTLRQDQIENITSYVLSWNNQQTDASVARANLEATRSAPTPDPNANPVAAGEQVFTNKGCVGCHAMNEEIRVGPGLGGLFLPEGTAAFGTVLPNNQPVNPENVREWIHLGSAGFPENINDLEGRDYPPMPGFQLTDEEWEQLYVWLRVHNRDGSLTEEGQELEQLTGQLFAPGSPFSEQPGPGEGQPGGDNVPTVVPTGAPVPPTGPDSPQNQPTSQVDTTAEAEEDATGVPQQQP